MAAVKKKKTSAKKTTAKKKKSGAVARKKKRPSLTLELKKSIAAFIVLGLFIATGAMVADYYLNPKPAPFLDTAREPAGTSSSVTDTSDGGDASDVADPSDTASTPGEFHLHDDTIAYPHKGPKAGLKNKHQGAPVPDVGSPNFPAVATGDDQGTVGETSGGDRLYEVFEDSHDIPERTAGVKKPDDRMPLIAIIIDDVGFDKRMAIQLAELDPDLTFSILPGAPYSRVIAGRLHARGTEIMLHLPMEPVQYPEVDPGPGALLSSMQPDELIDTLKYNLESVPHVIGVNNHMGSRLTTQSDQMRQIFTILKRRNLFFIDSLTAAGSTCRPSARLLQVPFAQRDVFLDNVQDTAYIRKQLEQLVRIARKHGTAIGIGHPYPATYETLKQQLPELIKSIRIVRASRLAVASG